MSHQVVLKFWFDEIDPAQWWEVNPEFDREIARRFGDLHRQASQGELFSWRDSAQGRLAEIIVLDQFSRNMFRDTASAFASDAQALALAQEAVRCGTDQQLTAEERSFLYMPFMHSESLLVHQQAEKLYKANGVQANYEFELKHKVIIERFGRYPHRNSILGRESTAEEIAFLQQPGSGF